MLDQGGTFTDIIGIRPDGKVVTKKILSKQNIPKYNPIQSGISIILQENPDFKKYPISKINIGTTIGTNSLLERKGAKVLFCVTKGFKDNFIIGNQKRDNLFLRHHQRPSPLYSKVIEIDERISKTGKTIIDINYEKTYSLLEKNYNSGYETLSIVLINSFKFPRHEKIVKSIAKKIGYGFISSSFEVCPMINFTSRGFTTLADNYLNPIVKKFTDNVHGSFNQTRINYMQSSGFLCTKDNFSGKTSILSGPAGGIRAGIKIAKKNNIKKLIGFDMGGTSTDIWHYSGSVEKRLETKISGIYLKTPVINIDSIAAGGGSIITYKQKRFVVGPDSAGSYPGPACYRNGGPLTITDCNLVLGKIVPSFFPVCFGKNKNQKISIGIAKYKFIHLLKKVQKDYPQIKSILELAEAYLEVAIENMSSAVKKVTSYKGIDLDNYSFLIFGSASGQLACSVAEKLKIKKIYFHPLSSFLSAYGVGVSNKGENFQISIEKNLTINNILYSIKKIKNIIIKKYTIKKLIYFMRLKYLGSNTVITVPLKKIKLNTLENTFKKKHLETYGFFYDNKKIFIDSIEAEIQCPEILDQKLNINALNYLRFDQKSTNIKKFHDTDKRSVLRSIDSNSFKESIVFNGPILFNDFNTTIVIKNNWSIKKKNNNLYEIFKNHKRNKKVASINLKNPRPEKLEIFNKLFFSVAEQMGEVLQNTAQSINVKERLDFSCALFDNNGNLIANAPHIPIHLGAMSDTIKFLLKNNKDQFLNGETLLHNDPYSGGTHLPDLTVVTPLLDKNKHKILFFFANRAHHSDIGGITPGSMPAFSKSILEEGLVFKGFSLLKNNKILDEKIIKELKITNFPSRDPEQNLNDIKAQIASCKKGIAEMKKIIDHYSLEIVNKYIKFVNKNCTEVIKKIIKNIKNASFSLPLDNGSIVKLTMGYNNKKKKLEIDFNGTSKLLKNNFNTPKSVTRSVITYFLRTLVEEDIPLNEGVLKDVDLIFPKDSMLNPVFPAPVVAGNVETSQTIIDVLNGATSVQASCYGTMSNITFGNKSFGYYETICGGEGASYQNNGTDAVHCHMTNTSITDAEILEWNYPVRLLSFSIRKKSGGLGKWTGGNGTIREILFLKNLIVTILSNRRKVSPYGIMGGSNGKAGRNYIKKKNKKILLPSSCQLKTQKGDSIIILTPGGGGYSKSK